MDCFRMEVLYLCVMLEDVDSFDKVVELCFEVWDNVDDGEVYDLFWEDDNSLESSEEFNGEEDLLCIESLELDLSEKVKVIVFVINMCNCKFGEGEKSCSASFLLDDFVESRNNCYELIFMEFDFVILVVI